MVQLRPQSRSGGKILEKMLVRAQLAAEKILRPIIGRRQQQLRGGTAGGKPLAAGGGRLAAGQQPVGSLKVFGQDFAAQAALPCTVGMRRIKTHAVVQAPAGRALQQQGFRRQSRALGGQLLRFHQQHAVAAEQMEPFVAAFGKRGAQQLQRCRHHAETRPAHVDAPVGKTYIGTACRQPAGFSPIGFGIVMQVKTALGRRLRQPQPIARRTVAEYQKGVAHRLAKGFQAAARPAAKPRII